MGLFDVSAEIIDSKNVIKITLASGTEKPYYIKKLGMSEKGTFIRIGTAAEPMPIKMIESSLQTKILLLSNSKYIMKVQEKS